MVLIDSVMEFFDLLKDFISEPRIGVLLALGLGLTLLRISYIRRVRSEREAADHVILSVPPERLMENFDLLNQPGVPEQVVSLMTTSEIMDILKREPKFEIVIDARAEEKERHARI